MQKVCVLRRGVIVAIVHYVEEAQRLIGGMQGNARELCKSIGSKQREWHSACIVTRDRINAICFSILQLWVLPFLVQQVYWVLPFLVQQILWVLPLLVQLKPSSATENSLH